MALAIYGPLEYLGLGLHLHFTAWIRACVFLGGPHVHPQLELL